MEVVDAAPSGSVGAFTRDATALELGGPSAAANRANVLVVLTVGSTEFGGSGCSF